MPSRSATSESGVLGPAAVRSRTMAAIFSKAAAARWPGKTTTERVGSGTSNSTTVHRSASTGRFVTESTANRNPSGTISQRV